MLKAAPEDRQPHTTTKKKEEKKKRGKKRKKGKKYLPPLHLTLVFIPPPLSPLAGALSHLQLPLPLPVPLPGCSARPRAFRC
jgi:hypothetical protein